MPHAIVIDIETLDTAPTAQVLTIGHAVVDLDNLAIVAHGEAALSADEQPSRTRSPETQKWWSLQSEDARRASFEPAYRYLAMEVFGINGYLLQLSGAYPDATWWGHGASFDLVIIESLARDLGYKVPWTYRQHRDLRTLYELAGGTKPSYEGYEGCKLTPHIAEDDAIAEALAMIEAMRAFAFGLHDGGSGLMGKARPEAIMPLRRDDIEHNETPED